MREAYTRARAIMVSFSIWHWVILFIAIAMSASPILGIVRGVKNGAVIHAVVSVFVPVYGLIYFFAAKQPRGN
jgi:hypothetical protein